MADFFGAASVQAFADEILKCSSEQRQRMLRQYYSQQNPDLTDVLTQVFPGPTPAADKPVTAAGPSTSSSSSSSSSTTITSSSSTSAALKPLIVACPSPSSTTSHSPSSSSSSSKPVAKKAALKFAQSEHAPKRHISSVSGGTEESSGGKKPKTLCPKTSSRNSGQTEASSSAVSGESKIEISTRSFRSPHVEPNDEPPLKPEARRSAAAPPSTEGKSREDPQVPRGPSTYDQRKNPHSSNSITDLLGDTSILDQLFKPKRKAESTDRCPSSASSSSLVPRADRKAKGRSKDLWDILDEGNEESINKLTDLTQIEKICSASSSPVKRDSQSTESPLWRKNEKFLWKKQD